MLLLHSLDKALLCPECAALQLCVCRALTTGHTRLFWFNLFPFSEIAAAAFWATGSAQCSLCVLSGGYLKQKASRPLAMNN